MTITPWREIAVPHQDVLKGTFQESEFAADISQVAQGKASREYQDPVQFFSRTFITEGMALLLDSVLRRLAGQGGDPVIQLQTAFGGGKTHTMLAVYHLAQRRTATSDLHGIPLLLDKAGIIDLSPARVAVMDGINLSVSEPKVHGTTRCHTLWGELAWQLGGEPSYALVRSADESGTSPDKDTVIEMLSRVAPCVILMDELVAFYRQFQEGKTYPAGSFETNMTFVQALTEGIKSVPQAILLASLPDSSSAGEGRGQIVLEQLENYFRRLHKIWKPVSKDEAFRIVRRRLFDPIEDHPGMENTCRAFAKFYTAHKGDFPNETQESYYLERMQQAYPIHPEIFDRLYEDWSTLQGFQRTRGVLQLLAQVIHRLWKDGNSDPLVMPGAVPLFDPMVRNKCLDYLPQGWEPIIDQDIDGEKSKPASIESEEARFGKIQAARRVARTLFLASAPGAAGRIVKGVEWQRILLGVGRPDHPLGHYKDVLKRLMDRLNFLNTANERYWFGLTPNLRREMESRKQRFSDQYDVIPLLRSKMEKIMGRGALFSGVHLFTPSSDIPDESGPALRLIVLSPVGASYRKVPANDAFQAAAEILRNRGDHPRQKQNRLLFLAADHDVMARVWEQAKSCLAWNSIVSDMEDEKLVLDTIQVKQARQYQEEAEQTLQRFLREAYRWLINPHETFVLGRPTLAWDVVAISPVAHSLIKAIEEKAVEEEWLITEWSAIHLATILRQWYFKEGVTEISALKVWQDTCHYLYLPRLINSDVFKKAMSQGVESKDFFGYATGKEEEFYLGFVFGRPGLTFLDESALLIDLETARRGSCNPDDREKNPPRVTAEPSSEPVHVPPFRLPSPRDKSRFYGTVNLDPVKAKINFATIVDEVIEQFTSRLGVDIIISVEIQASSKAGFDDTVQRTVKENCNVLRFVSAEFEE
ncbi:MAG: ATP-binding protein [Magnetococcales bacterium]|nr:ATP-binding protein [Magnetococcales bacterium]